MRSTYNNKKIMAAIAAAAMFGVGPALATTTIHVNNTTSKSTESVNYRTPDACDPSVAISVSGGNIVAAQQNYKNPSDVMDYKCDDGVIQTITANSNLDGIVTAEPLFASFDANASILDVKNTDTKVSCPADYIMDDGKCYKVNILTAAKVNVESQRKNANVTSSNATEAKDDAGCPSGYRWTKGSSSSSSYACRSGMSTKNPVCPPGFERIASSWGSSAGSLTNACHKYTCDDGFTYTAWQNPVINACSKYSCDDGYSYTGDPKSQDPVTNKCYTAAKTICPSGYEEVTGGIGDQACSMISHTSLTTDERVYVTEVTRYKNCSPEAATQSASGIVVKYAEADSAICKLDNGEFTLSGNTNEFGVTVKTPATVNLNNVSINASKTAAISIEDGVSAKVKFTGTNTLAGASNFAGIAKTSESGKLTIDGTSKENTLGVNGGAGSAAIGGNSQQKMVSNIEILAGTINAVGGQYGAAIGGGQNGAASTITIGNVTDKYKYDADDALTLSVTGGNDGGAGIGGGSMGGADNIVINNGFITANAPATAAIGAGAGMSCKDITINNGVLHAVGGSKSSAIGADGTAGTSCSDIVINNGSVNAIAGASTGANTKAIGKENSVTITGGSIIAVSSNETYDDIMDPKDAQGSPVHRFNIKATSTATDNLFVRSTTKGKFSAEAAVAQGEVFENDGKWENGKFFPTHHLDVGMNAGGAINQQDQIWAFFGENEEHDLMVNPSVTGEFEEKTVASSGKTSRIKWDATQSKFIYNIALLNSFPHDVLVYNGYEQGVKVDSSKIWIMGPDSSAFVRLSKSSSESKKNNYFKLNGDSLTNANVKCQEEFVSRNVSVTGTTGAPVALYCNPAGYLEGASDSLYTMTATAKTLYGKAQHVKFMLPYVLNNMEIANSIEPQTNDAKDPIDLTDGYDHLVYNGNEQTQEVASVTLFNKTHYVTDKFDNYVLVADQDYEVLGNKGTDASKFDTLKISAKSKNFVGEARRNFVIKPFDLANATFTFNPDSLVYNMYNQTQDVSEMFICADAEAAKTPTSCYKLGSNPKDLYEIKDTIKTDADTYQARVVKTCVDGDDFCSNVEKEATPAYNIAKYPIEKLEIAFNGDTMVYNGGVQAQEIDVSLKTLIKKTIAATEESEAKVEFVVVGSSSSNVYEVLGTDVDDEFDTLNYKATNAGRDTLTLKANDVEKNFTGSQKYGWQIGARDLAGNVWGTSSASTVCANYDKCVAGDESVITANVGKYGCRAVYPCDRGFEGYAAANLALDKSEQTYNAEYQENAVKSLTSKVNQTSTLTLAAGTDYTIMTAKAIKDHEADVEHATLGDLPSNYHLTVNGREMVKPYCMRHYYVSSYSLSPNNGKECSLVKQKWILNDGSSHGGVCTDEKADYENLDNCDDLRSDEVSPVENINVAVEGTGNFKGIQHTAYAMLPYKVEDVVINLGEALTYNGFAQTQIVKDITINGGNYQVTGDAFTNNFIVTGNTETDAGTYELTITGKKNYEGTKSVNWTMAPFDITSAEITPVFSNTNMVYDPTGKTQTQKVVSATVKINEEDIPLVYNTSSDSKTEAFDAGDHSITLFAEGPNFVGNHDVTFNVAPFDIKEAGYKVVLTNENYVDGTDPFEAKPNKDLIYNSEEQEQHFGVWTGASTLLRVNQTSGKDNYTVTGNKATDVGTNTIVVKGVNNFTGEITAQWTISKQGAVIVTVTLKDSTAEYTGKEYTYGGSDIIASAMYKYAGVDGSTEQPFDIANLEIDPTVVAKCTEVGSCPVANVLTGIKVNQNYKECPEETDCGVKVTGSASMNVTKAPVTVAVVGKTENVTFDNEEHKFAGYDVTIPEVWAEFLKAESFSCTACDSVVGKDAGEYALGLAKEKFANANGNFDVTFDVTDGKLVIDPATVQIKLYGNTKEFTFNGERQEVSGFSVPKFIDGNQDFVTLDDIKYTGDTSVSAVDAGIYEMVIDPALFSSANKNFNIEVTEFTNGKLTIKPAPIDVKITGNTDSKYYAARKFTVSGYDVKIEGDIEKAPFSKSDIALVNGAVAEVSAENVKMDGGKVAKYMMGLKKENFASRNQNYDVNFTVVADGYLEIKPVDIVVNIVGNIDSVKYNGKSQSVEGVSITANDPNFGVNDYTYTGATKASAKEGVVELKVDKSKFKLTNDNYIVTSFITKNGYIKVVKTDAIQTAIKSDVKVRAIESGIVVDNANGKAISVFTMNGKTVYSSMRGANTFGSTTISVPKGMYIVKVGSAAQRVNVK